MTTDKRTKANRENSRKSTGPRSENGKAASSRNALTHGLFTKHFVLLPGEDESQFDAMLTAYCREYMPATPSERHIVREMCETQWRLSRIGRQETAYLIKAGDNPDIDQLLKWDRLTNSARRAYRAALKDLHELRERRPYYLALSPEPGFEEPGCGYEPYPTQPPPPPHEPAPEQNEANSEQPQEPEPIRVPYDFAMELKDLKRFQPGFDPRRSRKMSKRLTDYCKDPDNLKAVVKLMYTI